MGNIQPSNNLKDSIPMVRVGDVIAVMNNTASVRIKSVIVNNPKTGDPEILGPDDYMNILDAPKIVRYETADEEQSQAEQLQAEQPRAEQPQADLQLVPGAEPTPKRNNTLDGDVEKNTTEAPNAMNSELEKTKNAATAFVGPSAMAIDNNEFSTVPSSALNLREEKSLLDNTSSSSMLQQELITPNYAPVIARWVGMGDEDHSSVWITYKGSRSGKVVREGDVVVINDTNARVLAFVGDALESRPMYALVTTNDRDVFYVKFIELMRGFAQ